MSDPVFPTNGPMLARAALMDKVWGALSKTTPSNLSVIGPRWIGKTVLLKAVADRAVADGESPYSLVMYWHLGHVCPTTDAEFISGLCGQLHQVMQDAPKDYSDYQTYLKEESYSHFKEITDLLDEGDEPVLMLWDGLDKPLGQDNLSVHLWDQMRSIIDGKMHKIVTATRAPLDLLIRNEEASTSEFWNIFDEEYVKPFDEHDIETLLEIARLELSSGGRTEASNWTGGHPKLLLELLNRLASGGFSSPISNENVVEVARSGVQDARRSLRSIWSECPQEAQEAYQTLIQNGETAVQVLGTNNVNALEARGFANVNRNKAKPTCHLLKEHLSSTSGDSGSLVRLFNDPDDFRSNIGDVLRIRLEQIPVFDNDLLRWVGQSILGIPDHPGDCLTNLTDIRDRALDLVMKHEFGDSREVPAELVEYWKDKNQHQNKVVGTLCGQASLAVPNERAIQVGLLQLLTGGAQGLENKADSVSKDTYEMISAIHGLRNRKQHADGQPICESVAVATIMMCLALLERLAEELS
ncbi:AAA-like domain-containing protein [Novipirellula artificiosorum]|uniref:NACHT domain protein n=1 Tax=Novipirellula artificiosorum TaxID=2528016 RepID=A0A5C6E399_9BACT|nr:AAA-like domain-containing protein [Novipirellula artificiosorum]TWU41886.1 hypothetical protein Poly41_01790 [Novipirellula artificiosorum]